MATWQVRSMDEHLYGTLGRRAEMDHRSISQEVVAILSDYLDRPDRRSHAQSTDALLELVGSSRPSRS